MIDDPSIRPPPCFIGDHRALDLLNTLAMPDQQPIEWLHDGADLLNWLEQSKAIDASVARKFRQGGYSEELSAVAGKARRLREWLRELVKKHAGSTLKGISEKDLAPLNRLLAEGETYWQVEPADRTSPQLRKARRWTDPQQLLQPIAETIADLLAHADFHLIRACEGKGCTLMFLDITKSHQRRWCSMAVCGNRAKAAAHRARARS